MRKEEKVFFSSSLVLCAGGVTEVLPRKLYTIKDGHRDESVASAVRHCEIFLQVKVLRKFRSLCRKISRKSFT